MNLFYNLGARFARHKLKIRTEIASKNLRELQRVDLTSSFNNDISRTISLYIIINSINSGTCPRDKMDTLP